MASSVIHMAVASEINKVLNRDYNKLMIGSIAPDISKHVGLTKQQTHFLTDNPVYDIPDIDKFLSLYKDDLLDDFVMGYFIHLYTDYLWFKYFIPEIYEDESVRKLDGTIIKCDDRQLCKYIYNDYTNMNIKLMNEYNISDNIFYQDIPELKNIIKEIPMDRLDVIMDRALEIIENTNERKEYVFDITNVKKFIELSIDLTLAKIKEIEIMSNRDNKEFSKEINMLESLRFAESIVVRKGTLPIIFSSPHTTEHKREDGSIKLGEPYTKAISLYLNKYIDTYSIIKNEDDSYDSNKDYYDDYNVELRRLIKEENIKLVIDLHGASSDRDFDVEFGTLNNLSADYSTIKVLEQTLIDHGITNITHNETFKGGAITQGVFALTDVDVIQLEINRKYRNEKDIETLKTLIDALIDFINKYNR